MTAAVVVSDLFQLFFRFVHRNFLIFGSKVNLGYTYTMEFGIFISVERPKKVTQLLEKSKNKPALQWFVEQREFTKVKICEIKMRY